MDRNIDINGRLEFISDLEERGFSQRTIESLLEDVDHPENRRNTRKYKSAQEFFDEMEGHWDEIEDIPDEECDEEGIPRL